MKKLLLLSLIGLMGSLAQAGCEDTAAQFITDTYHETVVQVKKLGYPGEGGGSREVWVGTKEGGSYSVYFNGPGCEWVSNHIRWN